MTFHSERPLRLLIATPRFFPLSGGVENHVYQVGGRLAAQGMNVTVLTADPSGHLPSSETVNGMQVLRAKTWPKNRDYAFAPEMYRLIVSGRWDVLHVQSYHTFVPFFAMSAALRVNLPYVLTFHGGGSSSMLRNLVRVPQRALLRPFLARAQRLVAVARFEIEVYGRELNLPPSHFTLIPNGADLPETSTPPIPAPGNPFILSVGRLEKYKGHQRAIAAMPHLLQQEPNAYLRIVGAGPYESKLRQLAERLDVASRVEIRAIPPEKRAEMAALVSSATLVVLLSDFETHPIAALEALALKRPVLVADNSGMRELAERGWARAIATHSSPSETAAAMLAQIHHAQLPHDLPLLTWDDCAAQLADLYRQVFAEAR